MSESEPSIKISTAWLSLLAPDDSASASAQEQQQQQDEMSEKHEPSNVMS